MADENNQNNLNNQNNGQSGSYYEPQQAENTTQYSQPQQQQPQQQQQYYQAPQGEPQYNYNYNVPIQPQEQKANIGLAILSFFIPIVGLVLFITQKKDKPKTAKACGTAALICVILSVIFGIIGGVASVFIAQKAFEDPAASEFLDDYSNYLDDYLDDYNDYSSDDNTLNDNSSSITSDTLGGDRQGYIAKPADGLWVNFNNIDYNPDSMVGFTNNSEIITMMYYDGTGYTKEDIRSSVPASLDGVIANLGSDVTDTKEDTISYDDFYAESVYATYSNGYQVYIIIFQSDLADDMIYYAIESPSMSTDEFESLVSETINSHSFVTHSISIDF